MSGRDRCSHCGGYPPEGRRLTLARPKSGDIVFCGYSQCYTPWAEQQAVPQPSPKEDDGAPYRPAQPLAVQAAAPGTDRCRSCNAPIVWGETEGGKRAPFNADGVNHFVTCPDGRAWRKGDPGPGPVQVSLFGDDEEPAAAPSAGQRHWDA